MQPESHYKHHIFFCQNERAPNDPRGDCARLGGISAQEYTKARAHELGLLGEKQIRVNKAGCLDRCEHGPVCVIYPDNVWYQFVDTHDLDEIIHEHLQHGRIVQRLWVDAPKANEE